MELSVIILNWNSKDFLTGCLSSLFKEISGIQNEVIVIDNGSTDNSIPFIEKHFPAIVLIKNNNNIGVGPARNQGLKIAKGGYLLILDVDTIINKGAIKKLLQGIRIEKKAGIIGPKLVDKNGNLQYSCRNFPTVFSKIYRQLPKKNQDYFLKKEELRGWQHESILEVGYVIGACQLIDRNVIADIGLYDPRMFYGVEEVDFCLRAWLKGWRVIYNPGAVITHFEQRIGRRQLFGRLQLEHLKSLAIYFFKHKYIIRAPKIAEIYGK